MADKLMTKTVFSKFIADYYKPALNAKQNTLTFDSTPTAGSTKPVTSGGVKTALDGKANSSHSHTIANVTGLQTALDGKANSSHTHAIADVTGLQNALEGKADVIHTHDDLYYQKSTIDALLEGKADRSEVPVNKPTLTKSVSGDTSSALTLTVTLEAMNKNDYFVIPCQFTFKTNAEERYLPTMTCKVLTPASGTYSIVSASLVLHCNYGTMWDSEDKSWSWSTDKKTYSLTNGATYSGGATLFNISHANIYGGNYASGNSATITGTISIKRTA